MNEPLTAKHETATPEFLSGGGKMGQLIRSIDWANSPLGAPETWPQSLRTTVSTCLNSRFPILIWWGPDLVMIYNDAYLPVLGTKHPASMGEKGKTVWPEVWHIIGPMLRSVYERGLSTWSENQLLLLERNGYAEECYFTFSYSPIYVESGGIGGVYCAVTETTQAELHNRQLETVNRLSNLVSGNKDVDAIFTAAATALHQNNNDFPFAVIYKISSDRKNALPIAFAGIEESQTVFPGFIDLQNPKEGMYNFHKAFTTKEIVVSENKGRRKNLPKGAWDTEATHFIHIPIVTAGSEFPLAIVSAALNPHRRFDVSYKQFASLIATQLALEVNNVLAYEEERKRAEALAEIDKAKTAFFTNISHEFRTPLTLMLGSLEALITKKEEDIGKENKEIAETSHRNALRLLRLVNNLLDFSRIEAGKAKAKFQLTDIAKHTTDIVSSFRSAIEQAGLQLHVLCDATIQPFFLDKEMWEKIVLNLLSNAFKYTLNGSITVSLMTENDKVLLKVADTGVGISQLELPKIFQRFHRVQNSAGRTIEGTGIGLSLVKELVQLHGGEISVSSEESVGTIFTVTLPTDKTLLQTEPVAEKQVNTSEALSKAFIEEASLLIEPAALESGKKVQKNAATVLVVDDNADMRIYIQNLLQKNFNVVTASNGLDALHQLSQQKIDLVVSDVMMPVMDGVELLKSIRENSKTQNIPVLFLSARAGEEAKIEGFDLGADDYLIKPFSAKELLARVKSQINLAKKRNNALSDVYKLFDEVPFAVAALKGEPLIIDYINQYNLNIWKQKKETVLGRPLFEARPDIHESAAPIHEEVYRTGKRFIAKEVPIELLVDDKKQTRFFNVIIDPMRNEAGDIEGQLATSIDISDQVIARKKVEESETELRLMANAMPQLVWVAGPDGKVIFYNDRVAEYAGASKLENGSWQWDGLLHPSDLQPTLEAWAYALQTGSVYYKEHRAKMKDGSYRWHLSRGYPLKNEEGVITKWFGTATDIHEQKILTEKLESLVAERTKELERSNEDLQQFAHVASHDLKEPVRKVMTFSNRLKDELGPSASEKVNTFLSKIESSAIRMYSMIDGVLLYSSMNALEQTKEIIDLNELIQNVEADLEVPIAERQALIDYKNLPQIEGSPILVYQLFYNLVNNSLKFAKADAPPKIEIRTSRLTQEELRAYPLQDQLPYVKITLKDNGIGFRNQDAEKIFSSFTRLHAKDKYEGTGLGLSLCRKIVERHGGIIFAEGSEGEGACFTMILPESKSFSASTFS